MTSVQQDEWKAIYDSMKDLPDLHCFPFPANIRKQFNIPQPRIVPVREFLESGYTFQCASMKHDLPPIIIDKPQKDGYIPPLIKAEEPEVKLVQKTIESEVNEVAEKLGNVTVVG